jgi:hypothetical protein
VDRWIVLFLSFTLTPRAGLVPQDYFKLKLMDF